MIAETSERMLLPDGIARPTTNIYGRTGSMRLSGYEVSDTQLKDPFLFIRQALEDNGISARDGEVKRVNHSPYKGDCNLMWISFPKYGDVSFDYKEKERLGLSLHLRDPEIDCDLYEASKGLRDYLGNKKEIKGKHFRDWDLEGSVSELGRYLKFLNIGLSYEIFANTRNKETESRVDFFISPMKGNTFNTIDLPWDPDGSERDKFQDDKLYPLFEDVRNTGENDFRPYFRRAIEIFAGRDNSELHNPSVYTDGQTIRLNSNDGSNLEERADFGDPLDFMREKSKELGIRLSLGNEKFDGKSYGWTDIFIHTGDLVNRGIDNGDVGINILMKRKNEVRKGDRPDRLNSREILEGKDKYSFNLKTGRLEDFELNDGELEFQFGYVRSHEDGYDGYDDVYVCVVKDKNGGRFSHLEFGNPKSNRFGRKLIDAKQLEKLSTPGDFRPYMHRIFEVWSGTPKEDWHNPLIYSQNGNIRELEQVIDSTVDLLFTGSERTEIEDKLKQAKLSMRKGWASVPRLSLGAVKLPTPGQNNALNDDFVTEAAPLFVEYMSTLGVMDAQEAEAIMAQRLTNYFIHKAGFQLNRSRAESLVDSLNGRELVQKIA